MLLSRDTPSVNKHIARLFIDGKPFFQAHTFQAHLLLVKYVVSVPANIGCCLKGVLMLANVDDEHQASVGSTYLAW